MNGITFIENIVTNPAELYKKLEHNVAWDERMRTRKTASYGVAYNYSQIHYPFREFIPELSPLLNLIEKHLDFKPNNCLINFYLDGKSTMGWHADQTDILQEKTGIAIISLGTTRTLRFREIANKTNKIDFALPAGSLIYMTQNVQSIWHHSVPKSPESEGRMSLTFRKIK